ncbi:MAG TPA: hypothetical protein VL095_07315 [Flavisolibacter sp.]|nr:hypothetical protein [Flavisolibacter sp.]
MATTQEKTGADRDHKPSEEQTNSEGINSKRSSGSRNVDNGENQVSNGTQSAAPAPGIATVGNTGAETSE